MSKPLKILLQTTIPFVGDDWHIGRFSNLARHLGALPDVEVTARDRATPTGTDDPVLAALDRSDFDELWLFAVDTGDGLTAAECEAISRFRQRGGGMMVTRDHADLGSSICEAKRLFVRPAWRGHPAIPASDATIPPSTTLTVGRPATVGAVPLNGAAVSRIFSNLVDRDLQNGRASVCPSASAETIGWCR